MPFFMRGIATPVIIPMMVITIRSSIIVNPLGRLFMVVLLPFALSARRPARDWLLPRADQFTEN
jgi:hypothetical protein